MPRTDCLTSAELTALHLGDLPETVLDELAEHLETCPRCEAQARALDGLSDPQLDSFRRSAQTQAGTAEEPLPERVGDYEVLDRVGRGGMGVVYRARHVALRRTVALKMLLGGLFADRDERLRFRAEAEAVARLQHPHIVQLFDSGEWRAGQGGPLLPYFTLEFVDGGSLASRLAGRPQPPQQAATWLEQLARAVHYAHQHGLVHRDLKPSNVLLTRDGQPKICDFGVAKHLERSDVQTRSGTLVGTAEYMAPEQAEGKAAVGPAADLYALGALLYAMLTGHPPFQGASPLDTLDQVRTQEPVSVRRLQPTVPRDLETICLKCLAKDPGRRYASALALAEDLRRFREGRPIVARPVGPLGRTLKWMRRNPTITGLGAAVVLVTLVGFGLVTWQWSEALHQKGLADDRATAEAEARRDAERLSAGIILDQALSRCTRGEVATGLLWLVRALELAGRAGDAELERLARINLAGWRRELVRPRGLLPHEDGAVAAAFSPDGRTVATGSKDGTAQLWDAATGKPRGEPLRHSHPVWAVAFSPDGQMLLTGSGDGATLKGEARLWNVATGQPLGEPLPQAAAVSSAAFSPDGRLFLVVCPEEVRVYQTGTRQPVGEPLRHPPPEKRLAGLQPRLCAAFSPDGKSIATGGENGTARLWDAATAQPRGRPLPHASPVLAVVFSPDGRTVLTGALDGTAQMWEATTGQPKGPPLRPAGWRVRAVAFSPDGQTLATGVAVGEPNSRKPVRVGEVHLWEAATGQHLGMPLAHPRPVRAITFSPNGRVLLTGCEDGRARFFETATGALLALQRYVVLDALTPQRLVA